MAPNDLGLSLARRLQGRLTRMISGVSGAAEVRVGFLENSSYPDGTPTAMVAAIQEFGAPSAGIPPRPYFRTMVAAKREEWGPATGKLLVANGYDARRTLDLAGSAIAGQLRESIIALDSPPLSPATIARKSRGGVGAVHGVMGPEKPLVDTGHMLASVDHEVSG